MDNLTAVVIVVYGVGAFGLILSFLLMKYGKPTAQEEAKKK